MSRKTELLEKLSIVSLKRLARSKGIKISPMRTLDWTESEKTK